MKDIDMNNSSMMKKQTAARQVQSFASLILTLGSAWVLSACGGGGGSSAPVPVVVNTSADLVGRWENPAANWDAKWLAPVSGQTASPIWQLLSLIHI